MSNPVPPVDDRLEDLHLYKEIAEHYAKCAISPEALRDWVIAHTAQPVPPAEITNIAVEDLQRPTSGNVVMDAYYAMQDASRAARRVPPAERNFCETCGKRLSDSEYIHTCTPPDSKA